MNKNISEFEKLYGDRRCFIIASGPSLNEFDLTLLKNRHTIGLNRSFLKYPDTKYHCVFDYRLFEMYEKELKNSRYLFTLEDRPFGIPIKLLGTKGFSWDLCEGIYSGYTISYFGLQLAIYLGFKEIYFLGLDLNNDGENTHFFGYDYNSKDHNTSEYPKMIECFVNIKDELVKRDIKVFNCSPNSKLTCFPYMDYETAVNL